jgi:uncharacterized membrane protein YdbT with pleckstrin-like domain
MKYVERVLQPGEEVRYTSRLHWLIYLPGAILIIIGVVVAYFLRDVDPASDGSPGMPSIVAFVIGAVFGLLSLLTAALRRMSVEVAVTDRRIIFKQGIIRRHTIEMNMNKVESVDVDQSVLGRIFDYGTITVRGTGSTLEPLRMIESPLEFRSHVIAG